MSAHALSASQVDIDRILSMLDDVFIEKGKIVPVPHSVIEQIPVIDLRIYCHFRCIYQIITTELVAWFKENVDLSSAIEIGSGNGTLGRALNIPITDNWQQADPTIAALYKTSGQPIIEYGPDVEKIGALDAIKQYKPKTVIGSWITHIYKHAEHDIGGNQSGVDELKLIELVDTYYLVGNLNIHFNNRLLNNDNVNCDLYHEPFLYSRNAEKTKNFIFEFSKIHNV